MGCCGTCGTGYGPPLMLRLPEVGRLAPWPEVERGRLGCDPGTLPPKPSQSAPVEVGAGEGRGCALEKLPCGVGGLNVGLTCVRGGGSVGMAAGQRSGATVRRGRVHALSGGMGAD